MLYPVPSVPVDGAMDLDLDQPGPDHGLEVGSYAWNLARYMSPGVNLDDKTNPASDVASRHSATSTKPPALPTDFDLIGALIKWTSMRPDIMQHASNVHGGWERWAQLDIYLMLLGQQIETHGEELCVENPSPRCDITIHQTDNGEFSSAGGEAWHLVELKCRGQESLTAFYRNKMQSDINKLVTNRPYKGYLKGDLLLWAVGPIRLENRDAQWPPYDVRKEQRRMMKTIRKNFSSVVDAHGRRRALRHILMSGGFVVSWWTENAANITTYPPPQPDAYRCVTRGVDSRSSRKKAEEWLEREKGGWSTLRIECS